LRRSHLASEKVREIDVKTFESGLKRNWNPYVGGGFHQLFRLRTGNRLLEGDEVVFPVVRYIKERRQNKFHLKFAERIRHRIVSNTTSRFLSGIPEIARKHRSFCHVTGVYPLNWRRKPGRCGSRAFFRSSEDGDGDQ